MPERISNYNSSHSNYSSNEISYVSYPDTMAQVNHLIEGVHGGEPYVEDRLKELLVGAIDSAKDMGRQLGDKIPTTFQWRQDNRAKGQKGRTFGEWSMNAPGEIRFDLETFKWLSIQFQRFLPIGSYKGQVGQRMQPFAMQAAKATGREEAAHKARFPGPNGRGPGRSVADEEVDAKREAGWPTFRDFETFVGNLRVEVHYGTDGDIYVATTQSYYPRTMNGPYWKGAPGEGNDEWALVLIAREAQERNRVMGNPLGRFGTHLYSRDNPEFASGFGQRHSDNTPKWDSGPTIGSGSRGTSDAPRWNGGPTIDSYGDSASNGDSGAGAWNGGPGIPDGKAF